MMLRFTRLIRSCHTQVERSSKRRSVNAKKRPLAGAPPQTFREVADREWFISCVVVIITFVSTILHSSYKLARFDSYLNFNLPASLINPPQGAGA